MTQEIKGRLKRNSSGAYVLVYKHKEVTEDVFTGRVEFLRKSRVVIPKEALPKKVKALVRRGIRVKCSVHLSFQTKKPCQT